MPSNIWVHKSKLSGQKPFVLYSAIILWAEIDRSTFRFATTDLMDVIKIRKGYEINTYIIQENDVPLAAMIFMVSAEICN